MALCHFNAYYLINQRRNLVRDRNILAETKEILLRAYDEARAVHEKTGCDCWNETLRSMDTIALVNKRAS